MSPLPPEPLVREVQSSDLELICQHREAVFLEAGQAADGLTSMTAHFRPWLAERLSDGRYFGFVLSIDAVPVASIGLMCIDWPPHPAHPTQSQRGYVLNVYVAPSNRRQGLARALMALADAEFKARRIEFAILHATQVGGLMYPDLGWVKTSEMAKNFGPYSD